jgi:hypothetical protein
VSKCCTVTNMKVVTMLTRPLLICVNGAPIVQDCIVMSDLAMGMLLSALYVSTARDAFFQPLYLSHQIRYGQKKDIIGKLSPRST